MKAQDTFSETVREDVKDWYAHTLLSRLDNKAHDSIVLVMQRLHVDDLAGHLLQHGDWTCLNLPAIAEIDYDIPLGQGRYHRRKRGQLLHPDRETHSVLEEAKREMGSMAFAAQYQQQPVIEDGNLIKWSWFRFYDQLPQRMTNDNHCQLGYRSKRKGPCQLLLPRFKLLVPKRGKVVISHEAFRLNEEKAATPDPLMGIFPLGCNFEDETTKATLAFI
jgi:hypothetical protein